MMFSAITVYFKKMLDNDVLGYICGLNERMKKGTNCSIKNVYKIAAV